MALNVKSDRADRLARELAAVRGDALLYVGDDFARTDTISALDT